MKFWIDDIRSAPDGYVWCHSVWGAMKRIALCEDKDEFIQITVNIPKNKK